MNRVAQASRRAGELHGQTCVPRAVGGFVITDCIYPPSLQIDRHDHELASLCVVIAGRYDETFGSKTRYAEPGTIIAHPEGEHHSNRHGPAQARLLTVEIETERLALLRPTLRIFDDGWHRKDEGLGLFAVRIGRELRRDDPGSPLAIESIVLEMLAAADRSRLPDVRGSRWLLRVRDCLDGGAADGPSMDQLTALAGVHPVHLARAFRRAFGCSVGSYARRARVARALILLQDQTMSLSSVAYRAGFADQSHMTRLVRAHTGCTPGAWRTERRGAS